MGVLGLTEVLLVSQDLTTPLRQQLETIQASGRALLNLVNNMLDLSRIDAKMLQIVPHVRIRPGAKGSRARKTTWPPHPRLTPHRCDGEVVRSRASSPHPHPHRRWPCGRL